MCGRATGIGSVGLATVSVPAPGAPGKRRVIRRPEMSMWDKLPIEELIEQKTARFYAGLARKKWLEQLEEVRELPEVEPPKEAAA